MEHDDDRLLWGAAEIGAALGLSARQAWHLLDNGKLPAQKLDGKWVSTRRRLREKALGQSDAA